MSARRWGLAVLVGLGCGGVTSGRAVRCEEPAVCTRPGVLQLCEDEMFVERNCNAHCMSLTGNFAEGCAVVPDSDDRCLCLEDPPPGPDPCDPEPRLVPSCSFDGEHVVAQCVGTERGSIPCTESCGDATPVGCFYDPIADADRCACASPGDPCDLLGFPTCMGADLLRCEGETWALVPCPASAGQTPCVADELGIGHCASPD